MCCNTKDAFILVEVRLRLLTLDGSDERLQILLCIWHSVMCLKERERERAEVQQIKPNITICLQNNPSKEKTHTRTDVLHYELKCREEHDK